MLFEKAQSRLVLSRSTVLTENGKLLNTRSRVWANNEGAASCHGVFTLNAHLAQLYIIQLSERAPEESTVGSTPV